MSDRRPEHEELSEAFHAGWQALQSDPEALLAAVRRGVESGTIEGTVMPTNSIEDEEFGELLPVLHVEDHGLYLVIPVSDGGED